MTMDHAIRKAIEFEATIAKATKAISFRDLYFCCEGAKRLPVYVQDLNGDFAQVTKVNIEKENGWIELVCDQVLTAENDEPEYADVNEWLEDRAMHGGIR